MPSFEVELTGDSELRKSMTKVFDVVKESGKKALVEAAENTAQDIKVVFKGDGQGFKDRTGALRRSITGGFESETSSEVSAFVSAGDDEIGSDGKPNREYAARVEFSDVRPFSKAGDASFLRPGVLMGSRQIAQIVGAAIKQAIENFKEA